MAIKIHIPEKQEIGAVSGVKIGIASAGVKTAGKKDLTVFKFTPGTTVSGVFTRNKFRAAPVQVCEDHLKTQHDIRAMVINTGNANAGTGSSGLDHAQQTCRALASELGLKDTQILPFSTGVIMEPLPVSKILKAIPDAVADLREDNWLEAAHSIMTTDTQPKVSSTILTLGDRKVTITGISKGAGMIRPNMATMLCFVATDADISTQFLKTLTLNTANSSFNRITVDGDTSTNDSFIIAATGQSGVEINEHSAHLKAFSEALQEICRDLSKKIIRDAEGSTKLVTVEVCEAHNSQDALQVAYSIAHSPLVKTALFAGDANLGRILSAIGYSNVPNLDCSKVNVWLGGVPVVSNGACHPEYQESQVGDLMNGEEINIKVALGMGSAAETVYTCDLSHEYVRINAEYRT